MKSLVRARAYPDSALSVHFWMGGILHYLEWEFRKADIYRCLALAEAISLVEFAREEVRKDIYRKRKVVSNGIDAP